MTNTQDSGKPSLINAMDALDRCKNAIGMLRCIEGAVHLEIEDKEDALGFVANHLDEQVHTLRAYFEMDKEEAASAAA
jgi:hypothetical protein